MGPMGCPETSVHNYYSTLRNNPEERKSQVEAIFATFFANAPKNLVINLSLQMTRMQVQSNPVTTTSVYTTPRP
jgi:hypothetical protein